MRGQFPTVSSSPVRFSVLTGTKGRGSNMAVLVASARAGNIDAEPAVVITPSSDSGAVERAKALQVPVEVVPRSDSYGSDLLQVLQNYQVDIICLAGFMFLLPPEVTSRFNNRIINIHPALLPKFGGKGMYGIHVHKAVLAAGESESGCTVHYVNEQYDEGAILLQRRCPVLPDDTPESLAERVLDLEHELYPEALQLLVQQVKNEKA